MKRLLIVVLWVVVLMSSMTAFAEISPDLPEMRLGMVEGLEGVKLGSNWLSGEVEKYEDPEQMLKDVMIASYVTSMLGTPLDDFYSFHEFLTFIEFDFPLSIIPCRDASQNRIHNKWILRVSPLVRIVLDSESVEYSDSMPGKRKNQALKELKDVKKIERVELQIDFAEKADIIPGVRIDVDIDQEVLGEGSACQ